MLRPCRDGQLLVVVIEATRLGFVGHALLGYKSYTIAQHNRPTSMKEQCKLIITLDLQNSPTI